MGGERPGSIFFGRNGVASDSVPYTTYIIDGTFVYGILAFRCADRCFL